MHVCVDLILKEIRLVNRDAKSLTKSFELVECLGRDNTASMEGGGISIVLNIEMKSFVNGKEFDNCLNWYQKRQISLSQMNEFLICVSVNFEWSVDLFWNDSMKWIVFFSSKNQILVSFRTQTTNKTESEFWEGIIWKLLTME